MLCWSHASTVDHNGAFVARVVQCDVDDNQGGFDGYRGRLRTIRSAVSSITEG